MLQQLPRCPPVLLLVSLLPLLPPTCTAPLYHPSERTSLAEAVNEHAQAAASEHARETWPAHLQEPRLPLPQNLDTIKKIAQILIMLGEQIIPGVTSDGPAGAGVLATIEKISNDPVNIG